MANQDAIDYLKQSLEHGHDIKAAKHALIQHGWSADAVEEAAKTISDAPVSVPKPPFIKPSKSAGVSSQAPTIAEHYTSPLSILLAILVFFALLVFTNKVVDDATVFIDPAAASSVETSTPSKNVLYGNDSYRSRSNTSNIDRSSNSFTPIIVQAVASAVFWIVAFAVYFLLKEHRRQFLVLSITYFLVAAFYLVNVLFGVLGNLFDTNAAMAVYVSLFFIIAVVTGSFVMYQKYFKKSL